MTTNLWSASCFEEADTLPNYLTCLKETIPTMPEEDCARLVGRETAFVFEGAYKKFLPTDLAQRADLSKLGIDFATNVFNIRVALKKRLDDYYANDRVVEKSCVDAIRRANRYFRFTEDILVELAVFSNEDGDPIFKQELNKKKNRHEAYNTYRHRVMNERGIIEVDLAYSPMQILMNREYADVLKKTENTKVLQLKSGDMILMRTPSFVSGVIARIGDEMGQFSHLTMSYVDEEGIIKEDGKNPGKKGQVYIIESLVETGLVYWKIEDWSRRLTDKKTGRRYSDHSRAVIYRLKKEHEKTAKEMAKRLIQIAVNHDIVFDKAEKKKQRIQELDYNFKMNMKDATSVFCSQVARLGACMASNNLREIFENSDQNSPDKYSEYKSYIASECSEPHHSANSLVFPTFPTTFNHFRNHPFLKEMSNHESISFAPVDLEVDPLVDLIGEWRNPTLTAETRASDAIFESMMKFMYEKNYYYTNSRFFNAAAEIAMFLRKNLGFLKKMIRTTIPQGFMKTVIYVNKINSILTDRIYGEELDYFFAHGHSRDYSEILKSVENFRKEDCARFHQQLKCLPYDEREECQLNKESTFHSFFMPYQRFENGGELKSCEI